MLDKTYLVTGGAGFIGSHLLDRLINENNHVICIDDLSTGSESYLPQSDKLNFREIKIQDIETNHISKNIDGIFHLAAQASVPVSIEEFYQSSANNILGTLKVWDLAKQYNIPIIYASSSAVYGNLPLGDDQIDKYDIISPYAQDKLTMEHYARICWDIYQTPSIGLRFFNVYGPRQDPQNPYSGVISVFADRLLNNKSVTVNGGYQTRDFIYVEDIVKVMVESMNHILNSKCCEVFNVGTGISITIDNLLSIVSNIIKVKPEILLKDLPSGDSEKSDGTYQKIKDIINVNIEKFIKLEDGLSYTIKSMETELNR